MTRAYRRPTNGLRSPRTQMSWDSACTESQTEINEGQAETGLSSRISRGMFIEDFKEKATGWYVRNQMGFMHKRHDRRNIYREEKLLNARQNPEKASACFRFFRKSEIQFIRTVKNSTFVEVHRRFDWNVHESPTQWCIDTYIPESSTYSRFWRFYR